MRKRCIHTVSTIAAAVALFASAQLAYAYTDLYIELAVKEDDDSTIVDVEYEEDGETVVSEYEYQTTDVDEVYELIAEELDIAVETVKAAVDKDVEDEDEDGDKEENDEDEKSGKEKKDKCDGSFPGVGHGVKKQCDPEYEKTHPVKGEESKEKTDKKDTPFKEYGKTTDKVELQLQIQELLQLLIKLLSQQMMVNNQN